MTKGLTLLDIGCGDGLIGLGALTRMGASGRVIFLDVSRALLRHAEQAVAKRGWSDRSSFVLGSAERLDGVDEGSVDAVTARAVLAYVQDKAAAAREIYRVLRPGGRLSIGEPIFRDFALQIGHRVRKLAASPACEATAELRLVARCQAAQYPTTVEAIASNPLTNFSEWDLVSLFEGSGFSEIHLEFHIDVWKALPMRWETFIDVSPHPLAPTLREILQSQFSAEEAMCFEAFLRPEVEAGNRNERETIAYLTATKPGEDRALLAGP